MSARRRIYIVRHAEREDNINKQWEHENQHISKDNSPLSERGRSQCQDLRNYFENIRIDKIYASPFDRTMETASILLGTKADTINAEPGLCEVLYMCTKPSPGFASTQDLVYKYPRTNMQYSPVFTRASLPEEGFGDESCCDRVRTTLHEILANDFSSENIVLVSHGATIGALHAALGYDFTYVGQATISIFEEVQYNSFTFKCVASSNKAHLSPSNSQNLRAY